LMRAYEIDPEGFERRGRAVRQEFIGVLADDSGRRPNRSTYSSTKVIECQLVTE
jgi:hypothetical protein